MKTPQVIISRPKRTVKDAGVSWSVHNKYHLLILALVCVLSSCATLERRPATELGFDVQDIHAEFPNHFLELLPEGYRNSTLDEIPADVMATARGVR